MVDNREEDWIRTENRRIYRLKAKVSSISAFICLITLVFFCILACDNGSSPAAPESKTDGLVNVCFTVAGDSSDIQKSSSIGGSGLTYQYKAVPQWSQDQPIHGRTPDWIVINYSAGMSLGYFAPGQWIFYIRILNQGTPVYEGHSAIVRIGSANANVTVNVTKIVPDAASGAVRATFTAPVIDALTDALTVTWSGTASGSASAAATTAGGTTTFTFNKDDLADGSYTFTFTHSNVAATASEAVVVSQGNMVVITGHLDNGEWQTENTTLQFHNITIVKYNWGTEQDPEYCGSADIDVSSSVRGDRVSFSLKPVTNSDVDDLAVTCGGNPIAYSTSGNLYTFIMPDGDVTINVRFVRVSPEEVDVMLFKTIIQALYFEHRATVQHFGQAASSPGPGDKPATLGDVKIWYDSSAHKICWYSDADKLKLGAGSLIDLFRGCDNYITISLRKIITSDITNMSGMFQDCTNLTTLDLTNLNASSATDISNMIQGCTSLSSLTLTGVTTNSTSSVNMAGVFKDCSSLTILTIPAGFDASKATSLAGMFQGCSGLTGLNLTNFNASSATDMSEMFQDCTGLTSITLTGFTANTTSGVNMAGLFKNCSSLTTLTGLSSLNASKATSLASMFQGCSSLTGLDLTNFNASSATDLSNMFQGCTSLASITLTGFTLNTTSGVNMAGMFKDCENLYCGNGTLDLSSFDTTQATDMSYMFCACKQLRGINFGSNFHTANVTDMSYMFSSADWAGDDPPAMNLTSLDVSGFRTPKVTNMRQMFYLCYNLTALDVSNFDTSRVTDMSYMFACFNYGGSKYPGKIVTLNLAGWDFTNVTSTGNMFDRQQQLKNLTFPNVTNFKSLTYMSFMFSHCLALTPATFTTIVSKWTFANNPNDVYARNNNSLFGNTDNDRNLGANYIFRDSMTKTGGKFETRDSYATADGVDLYIGGGNSVRHGRLTVFDPLP